MSASIAVDASHLQTLFHAAPFEEGGWHRATGALAARTGSRRGQLLAIGRGDSVRFNYLSDPLDDLDAYQREFVEIGAHRPEVNWRMASAAEPFRMVWETHYDIARARSWSEAYEAHAVRWEGENGCQMTLVRQPDLFIGLAALRSRSEGRTRVRDRRVFAAAAPHVLAAIRMQQALEDQGARLVAGALDAMDAAAFVCDVSGQVRAMTRPAEAALAEGRAVLLRHGLLHAARREAEAALRDACRTVLHGEEPDALVQRIWLADGEAPGTGMLCELFRLARPDWAMGFAPRLLVVLRRPADLAEPQRALLHAMLGLTGAEAHVALGLANGLSREEVAQRRGVSVQTVNAQLKSIFRKGDVDRETALAAMVNRLLR